MKNLDTAEIKFRETPESNSKYAKRLTRYIEFLLSSDRILESEFYFKKLHKLKQDNLVTAVLGYKISIKTFNKGGVLHFDKIIFDMKNPKNEITHLWLQLQFYYSQNNATLSTSHACFLLLNHELDSNVLTTIIEIAINTHNYKIASTLTYYMRENRITPGSQLESNMKRIAIKKLADTLSSSLNHE